MSSKIDERVVNMKFNSDQFEQGTSRVSKALASLKSALNLGGAAKGLQDVDNAAKNFSLQGIANGVQDIAGKFSALSIIGITALANIANKAVDAGLNIAKSLTIDPIKAGFAEYELKLGSIQTILANTSKYGTTLGEVTANLDELNTYADKTIYNFGDMTKNIGLFTNAGIRIEDATSMIKGFSNAAAASGTSAAGASGAAYQLSQALSKGKITLEDWRSLSNVGMGNKNMQQGLIDIASAMGTFTDKSVTAEDAQGRFTETLQEGWLTADVMSSYLQIMAGDMDAAKLASMGLSDEQIANFQAQQKTAEEAATKVRTFTQLVDTLREANGSGWTDTIGLLIGDFDQATELWTGVNNTLGTILGEQAASRNALVKGFVDSGGRDAIINSVKNIWEAFQTYIQPIATAWKNIFPPVTVDNLMAIVNAVLKFTETLKPNLRTTWDLQRTFQGLFAILDMGWMIIKALVGVFVDLFSGADEGASGILSFTARIGDWLVKVRDSMKAGTGLADFMKTFGDVLQWPIDQLSALGKWTRENVNLDSFRSAWESVGKVFEWLGEKLAPVGKFIGEAFENLKNAVKGGMESMSFDTFVGLLNVGALGAVFLGIKKLVDTIKGIFNKEGGGDGIGAKIKGILDSVTGSFDEMQNTLKSASLTAIAIAIALITASVIALSFVDTGKLFISLGAIGTMFAMLSAMLLAMDKLTTTVGAGKIIAIGIALSLLAGAILIMSTALLILSTMSWEELARGLSAIAVGLGLMIAAVRLIGPATAGKLVVVAGAMLVISTALVVLAAALKITATLSWDDILRSMVAMGGALAIIIVAMNAIRSAVGGAASMIIVSVAINILAGAMKIFATMSWDDILRSSVVFAAVMGIMVGGLAVMAAIGPMALVGAAAMTVAALAITILTGALKIMATMSWDDIGRTMVVMAGSLAILAGAMFLMGLPPVLLGAAGLIVAATAMMILAPALKLMGSMSWDDIGRGMALLGASLAILAVGGLLMIPASVGFLLLGAAILLLGTGLFLASVGIASFAASFALFAAAGAVGIAVMKLAVETLIALIPTAMAAFAQGIIDFALVIANGATEFTAAATTLIRAILLGILTNGPLVIETIWTLVTQLVDKVVEGVPYFVDAGMKIIIGVLDGINANLDRLIDAATTMIVKFLDGISRNLSRVTNSAANLVVAFVNSVADAISSHSEELRAAGLRLATAIADGMTGGLASKVSEIANKAGQMARAAVTAAETALGIASPSKVFTQIGVYTGQGLANGITKSTSGVVSATEGMGSASIEAMKSSMAEVSKVGMGMESIQPKIRPVLDLSNVKQGATLMGNMLKSPSFETPQNYAMSQSLMERRAETTQDNPTKKTGNLVVDEQGRGHTFTQIINSPKPLSRIEIYRQTRNLVSSAQEVLKKP